MACHASPKKLLSKDVSPSDRRWHNNFIAERFH
jgi:hypothetical protein